MMERPVKKLEVKYPVEKVYIYDYPPSMAGLFEDQMVLSIGFYPSPGFSFLKRVSSVLFMREGGHRYGNYTPAIYDGPDQRAAEFLSNGYTAPEMVERWQALVNHVLNLYWMMDAPQDRKLDPDESWRKAWTMLYVAQLELEALKKL